MSLKKAIEHGKEHRKMNQPLAPSCRHHGSCPFCSGNRMRHRIKDKEWTQLELNEFKEVQEIEPEPNETR